MRNTRLNNLQLPHPVLILLGMLLVAAIMSYFIQAGAFDREIINGKSTVIAGTYKFLPQHPLGIMDIFLSIPQGFKTASDIIFIIFASGIMFGFMQDSGAVENGVGTLIKKLGVHRRYMIVVIMTFLFGALGIFVGYENNIAMVPFAVLLSYAIGGDLILAAGISVGAITVGFGLSPVNPYTLGTGHAIAQLPIYSGALLRSVLCLTSLSYLAWYNVRYLKNLLREEGQAPPLIPDVDDFRLKKEIKDYQLSSRDMIILSAFALSIITILYGVFKLNWFITHIAAVFTILAIVLAIICQKNSEAAGKIVFKSISSVAPGAFMVGLATSIKVVLENGQISDTISYALANSVSGLPVQISGIAMTLGQTLMNFVIPSGSGQALATLPIMIPMGDLVGLSRQCVVLAFQIGDGASNLVNPALGGLIAMLAACRVSFDKWLVFIWPVFVVLWLVAVTGLIAGIYTGY